MVVVYEYSTTKGYYFRHMQMDRAWIRQVAVCSPLWLPCRFPPLAPNQKLEAEDAPTEPKHDPCCIAKRCRKRAGRSSSSRRSQGGVGGWTWEEPIEFDPSHKLDLEDIIRSASLRQRHQQSESAQFGPAIPGPTATKEEDDATMLPEAMSTSTLVAEEGERDNEPVAAQETSTPRIEELCGEDGDGKMTKEQVSKLVEIWTDLSDSQRTQIESLLEVKRAGLCQDFECARQLGELFAQCCW